MGGGNTSRQAIEHEQPTHPFSLRSAFERFSSAIHPDRTIETPLSELVLDTQTFESLPFPIALTDGGYTISRRGEPLKEETGTRVFIVDTTQLRALYESQNTTPEQMYEELKHMDMGGRLLCLGDATIRLDPSKTAEWTVIVKTIEHPHKNHWKTPDKLRLAITPQDSTDGLVHINITQQLIETETLLIPSKPINLSLLTHDCPLHIVEPWTHMASPFEKEAFERNMRDIQASDEQREDAVDVFDRDRRIRQSNTNTLLCESLRDHVGSIPAPPIEAFIIRNADTGGLTLRIDRTPGLYDRLLHANEEEKGRIIRGLPHGMNIETLANTSYGVNGVSTDENIYFFEGKDSLHVDLMPMETQRQTVTLCFNANTERLRNAVTLQLYRENGHVMATVLGGIESGNVIGFGSRQERTIFTFEQQHIHEIEAARARFAPTALKWRHNGLTAEEKQRLREQEYISSNPLAYGTVAPHARTYPLHR